MTRLFAAVTVLLIHTGAAFAQQAGPQPGPGADGPLATGPGTPPPPAAPSEPPPEPIVGPPAPATPPPPDATPAAPPPPSAAPVQSGNGGFPPGYEPPPGYTPPPSRPPTYYGPPRGYGAPPAPTYYGPPPRYYRYHYAPPPPRRITDRPFTLGGGIGFGGLKFIDAGGNTSSQGGLAYTARLGLGLAPGLILMWDIEGATVTKGSLSFMQAANLLALQIFAGDRLFIKGGFGLARASNDYVATNWGGALMGGIGVELFQGASSSIDIESTVTGARYDDETWINWSLVNFAVNFY